MRRLAEILDTPWKICNQVSRIILLPINYLLFLLNGIPWKKGYKLYGVPIIQKHRKSSIEFGGGLSIRSTRRSNPLGANHAVIICTWKPNAVIKIGKNFAMTGGSMVAAEKILIGNNVTVGANCTIIDTDFHPLSSAHRRNHPQEGMASPIVIRDDVFIGMNSLVLKGVTIGSGAVVGAGSVVANDVPSNTVVAGNPAVVIGRVD